MVADVSDSQVVVLGGGITGCMAACLLADAGVRVVLVERQERLMEGASGWNDGKVHLGYTFIGTPSLTTAALLQRGSAAFFPLLERVLGGRLPDGSVTAHGVIYLVDRRSMVDAETLWERARTVTGMLAQTRAAHPGLDAYPGLGQARIERLPVARAEALTAQTDVVAAWRVPETHCVARTLGDRLRDAVHARPIELVRGRVTTVGQGPDGWRVRLEDGTTLGSQVVINATWEERALIDRTVRTSETPVSIRFKYALFGEGVGSLGGLMPFTRILGRYGDVVPFDDGSAYLSWYPACLVAWSDDGRPPAIPPLDVGAMTRATLAGLGLPPSVVEDPGARWQVRGGYVVAYGYGDIDRTDSPLHVRDRVGVTALAPGYLTVDTGKLTLGPMFAAEAATAAARHVGVAMAG